MVKYSYDALAATVRMKDITSDARNRAVLHRIKNNDPSLTKLYIGYEDNEFDFVIREGDDLDWLGYYIGKNEILESLGVFDLRDQAEKFFIGLQRNKSIKGIELDGCASDSFSSINLPHVTTMTVDLNYDAEYDCERTHHIAVGLQRCKSLVEYDGPMASEIVTSLTTLPMLENVILWGTSNEDVAIGREECVALKGLFAIATNLKHLHIFFTLGNEGLAILAEELACNTKLRELKLDIGDAGLEALADSLACNRTLRVLSIARNTAITVTGVKTVSRILHLQSGMSGLEDLCLDGINISDEGGLFLAAALSVNQTLVSLSLKCDWGGVSIGDYGLRALALGLSQNSHLKSLNLSGNTAITASGLRSLEDYFGSPSCALEKLELYRINIGDRGARALADALRRNKSLRSLFFNVGGITSNGWNSFLNLICDPSSPNNLYLSNHTLCDLGDYLNPSTTTRSHVKNLIARWLKVNNDYTPNVASKTKILPLFYANAIDMVPLFQWDLKLLPSLKLWFNILSENREFKASIRNNELSCIYKFVRGFPMLVGDNLRRYLTRQGDRTRTEEESSLMQG